MSAFHFITPPDTPCPACPKGASVAEHNIRCAATGERSYTRAVNVPARTVEAHRIPQGSGAHGSKEMP